MEFLCYFILLKFSACLSYVDWCTSYHHHILYKSQRPPVQKYKILSTENEELSVTTHTLISSTFSVNRLFNLYVWRLCNAIQNMINAIQNMISMFTLLEHIVLITISLAFYHTYFFN